MKKLLSLVLAMMMVLSAASVLAETEEKKTLVMATNATFPPYEYWDGEEIVGIDVEIAAAIASYLGCDFKVSDMEFDSIISAVNAGKADFGLAGMTVTEDRLAQIDFTDSYATGVQVVIVKEDSEITSVDDLFAGAKKWKVGVQQTTTGDIYCSDDLEATGLAEVVRFLGANETVMALKAGKIDCVVIDNEPAKAFVAANEGLKILDTEYVVENYAACIAKENTELKEAFNAALKALTEDGTIPAIIEKYIPTTTEDAVETEAAE